MVDWNSPQELAIEGVAFNNLIFALFGLYVWELVMTCSFEWSLITRKRKMSWPLIFFFLCRYCMLLALIGLIISLTIKTKINCGALYTFISFAGNMTALCASTSLMIRTLALWEFRRPIVVLMVLLALGHWAIEIRGMAIVHAVWDPQSGGCAANSANHVWLNANYFYTMGFDCVILIFTATALGHRFSDRGLSGLLFRDGLVYFIVTTTCNTIPAVLNVLDLNVEMNVIATIPAATASAVASCRAVMRLKQFYSTKEQFFVSPLGTTSVHDNTNSGNSRGNGGKGLSPISPKRMSFRALNSKPTRPEIRVTTDSFTMAELTSPSTKKSPLDKWDSDARSSDSECLPSAKAADILEEELPSPGCVHFARDERVV